MRRIVITAFVMVSLAVPEVAAANVGDLDPSFGHGGIVVTHFEDPNPYGPGIAQAVAIQPDGRIVAAGHTGVDFSGRLALARYLPDGSLDPTFGTGGQVVAPTSGPPLTIAYAATIDSSGRIVVAGDIAPPGGGTRFAVARFNPDGSLDSSFGSGGAVTTTFSLDGVGEARSLAIDSSGRIVAGGWNYDDTGRNPEFALARYEPNGTLDPTFGSGGKVVTPFVTPPYDKINSIALDSAGRIVAAGNTATNSGYELAVTRYNPDGSLDSSFGTGGKVSAAAFGSSGNFAATHVIVDPSDRPLIGLAPTPRKELFGVARLTASGAPDPSFNGTGFATASFPNRAGGNGANSLVLDSAGRIVAAAGGTATVAFGAGVAVARFLPDGTLDDSFGSGGLVVTEKAQGLTNAGAKSVTLDASGRIVTAGFGTAGGTSGFTLTRYLVTDGVAPQTDIPGPPARRIVIRSAKAKVKLRFTSNESGSTFHCKLDKRHFTLCTSPKTYKVKPGKHLFEAVATDRVGNRDKTPAKARFKVVRRS
jgi:uncharacterized delta-60 repeat protein